MWHCEQVQNSKQQIRSDVDEEPAYTCLAGIMRSGHNWTAEQVRHLTATSGSKQFIRHLEHGWEQRIHDAVEDDQEMRGDEEQESEDPSDFLPPSGRRLSSWGAGEKETKTEE